MCAVMRARGGEGDSVSRRPQSHMAERVADADDAQGRKLYMHSEHPDSKGRITFQGNLRSSRARLDPSRREDYCPWNALDRNHVSEKSPIRQAARPGGLLPRSGAPGSQAGLLPQAVVRPWGHSAQRLRSGPCAHGCQALLLLGSRFYLRAVVLLPLDLAAVLVFRLVGLLLLLRGQRAAVGYPLIVNLLRHPRLICIGAGRLA